MRGIELAIVGCGRATASLHLPAAAFSPSLHPTVLVDIDLERARGLARRYGVAEVRSDVNDLGRLARAAVVALPHHLHAPVTRSLLEQGIDVLVEKPLATSVAECDELIELAREGGRVLGVGMVRRRFPAMRLVARSLERGILGPIERVEVREGAPFSWEVASDFTFRRDMGGGVLADTGIHLLDLLGWWFEGLELRRYRDDSYGGAEAECEIELELPEGAPVLVELSRTRNLPNTVRIQGERGMLEAETAFGGRVALQLGDRELSGRPGAEGGEADGPAGRPPYRNVRELFLEQLEEFAESVAERRPPSVDGAAARRAVAVVERCHEIRETLDLPWVTSPTAGLGHPRRSTGFNPEGGRIEASSAAKRDTAEGAGRSEEESGAAPRRAWSEGRYRGEGDGT